MAELRPDVLARIPWFASIGDDALRHVAEKARTRRVEAGGAFFREGEPAASLFVVQNGSVKLTQLTPEGHQVVLRLLGQGDPFGGVSAFGGGAYPATAEAVTNASAYEWPGPVMAGLMER